MSLGYLAGWIDKNPVILDRASDPQDTASLKNRSSAKGSPVVVPIPFNVKTIARNLLSQDRAEASSKS